MAKEKQLIEYRYYEMPVGHYVIPIIGKEWERYYAPEVAGMLHFHNYLEIGYCYWGNGRIVIEDTEIQYKGNVTTIIPQNIPHSTETYEDGIDKWEFIFIDIENFIRQEMNFSRLLPEEVIKTINKHGYVIQWSQNRILANIVKMIIDEYREKKPHYKQAVRGYLRALVVELLRISEDMSSSVTIDEKRMNSYIEKGVNYINEHYTEDFKLSEVADVCGLSESHFRRIFGESMSMKPWDYINMIRVNKACELLVNEDVAVDEIGYRVGFGNPSTFTRNFKKIIGTTPYQWKKDAEREGSAKNFKISAKKGW